MKGEELISDSEYSDVSEEDAQIEDGESSPLDNVNDRSLGKFMTEKAQVAAAAVDDGDNDDGNDDGNDDDNGDGDG
eukprot:751275-Hanusia_phi.AAC.1